MTSQLKLSNWGSCPAHWQNFVKDIQNGRATMPESEFWYIVRNTLREKHNAELIARPNKTLLGDTIYDYVEFKQDRDLTMFLLRWS